MKEGEKAWTTSTSTGEDTDIFSTLKSESPCPCMLMLISSIIKDAELWITQFLNNITVTALNNTDSLDVNYLLIEGNSNDETYPILSRWADNCKLNVMLVKHDLPEEMAAIDRVMDSIELIPEIIDFYSIDARYIMLIDSDIIKLPSNMLTNLIDDMENSKADIIAPYVLISGTDKFYDTHVFRMNNEKFGHAPPYTPNNKAYNAPFEVDSAGTCLLFRSDVFMDVITENKKHREEYRNQKMDGYIGLCKTAKLLGYRTLADPTVKIYHVNLTTYGLRWHSVADWQM